MLGYVLRRLQSISPSRDTWETFSKEKAPWKEGVRVLIPSGTKEEVTKQHLTLLSLKGTGIYIDGSLKKGQASAA